MVSLDLSKDRIDSVCSFTTPYWRGSSCISDQANYGTVQIKQLRQERHFSALICRTWTCHLVDITNSFDENYVWLSK